MWGLIAIYAANVLYRVCQTLIFWWMWRSDAWTSIEV
jgi:hypothetical protein